MQTVDPRYNTVVVEYEREDQTYKLIRSCDDPEFLSILNNPEMIESIRKLYLSKGAEVFSIRKVEKMEVEYHEPARRAT